MTDGTGTRNNVILRGILMNFPWIAVTTTAADRGAEETGKKGIVPPEWPDPGGSRVPEGGESRVTVASE